MGNLEERRHSVQNLFRPDGSLTHMGKILFQAYFDGCNQAAGGRREAALPHTDTVGGWSEEGMRTIRRTFLPEGPGLSRRSKLRDPFAGILIKMGEVRGSGVKLAFKKEGWGALLEEHPRGCLAFRLSAWGGRPVVEAALILPHPHDQVSEEHKLHVFELEGGGLAKWTQSGLELTDGKIIFTRGRGLKVETLRHHTPSEGDGRRTALWEASLMRGASYEGLSALAQRLRVQPFGTVESLLDWDPHLTLQARAESLLNKATLALAHQASAILFREPQLAEFRPEGPCAVRVSGQPLSARGLERVALGERLAVLLRLEWGKMGVPPLRRFEDSHHTTPKWIISCLDQDFRESGPLPLPSGSRSSHKLDTEEGFAAFSEELITDGIAFLKQYLEVRGW